MRHSSLLSQICIFTSIASIQAQREGVLPVKILFGLNEGSGILLNGFQAHLEVREGHGRMGQLFGDVVMAIDTDGSCLAHSSAISLRVVIWKLWSGQLLKSVD